MVDIGFEIHTSLYAYFDKIQHLFCYISSTATVTLQCKAIWIIQIYNTLHYHRAISSIQAFPHQIIFAKT